ncbi:aspartic peptidase domain-containing protein [Calycina marina]|uniref:Aspartic peptidase domain-containing protein n=1 Tax=Calycina marina TaxID=1763456 RepID=A0A9P7ZA47_9HELO|nr:aspartic peptidase domain-containing protein [Calycina marina]
MMLSFQSLLVLALVSLSLALPSPPVKRSFKIVREANPNFKRLEGHKRSAGAGTRALIYAHRKYSVSLPAGLLESMKNGAVGGTTGAWVVKGEARNKAKGSHGAASARPVALASGATAAPVVAITNGSSTGTVVATPVNGDVEYISNVNIGGQVIPMDFDTGSSDLWVFNTQLASASQQGHTVYDSSNSTTFEEITGATYSISYGDGSGSAGNVGTDTVNIGGVTVTSQAIEMATAVSTSFIDDTDSNGLVGLAFSTLNTVTPTQQKTFFDNAMTSGTLADNVFTADLRKNEAGAYEFGTIDATRFNGNMVWAAVNTTNGFWQFSSQSFSVAGSNGTITEGQAIADTGTSLMLANAAVINGYYSMVSGAVSDAQVGGVTFPCNTTLPDLQIDVGGNMATVRGDDLNFAPVDAAGTTCFGGLQVIDSDLQIYGDIMFKSQFVAFNGANNSLGFAPHSS